jgi:hypothetical protein
MLYLSIEHIIDDTFMVLLALQAPLHGSLHKLYGKLVNEKELKKKWGGKYVFLLHEVIKLRIVSVRWQDYLLYRL